MNTKNNTALLNSKNKIETGDIEYIDHVKRFGTPYANSIYVLFSDGKYGYGVKGLKYVGLRQRKEPKDTELTYYNIKRRHYIEIVIHNPKNIHNPKKLKFHGRSVDEVRKNYTSYFSPHDIRQAPDGTLGQYSKFLHDALSGNLHGCYLEKLKPQKGSSTAKSSQYNERFPKK